MDKTGLLKLGLVKNIRPNEKKENCITYLSALTGKKITLAELNAYIESADFTIDYFNEKGDYCTEGSALSFRFKLPWLEEKTGLPLFGVFNRDNISDNFIGVQWKTYNLDSLGTILPSSWDTLQAICAKKITKDTILNHIISEFTYYNKAGYVRFPDGTLVTKDKARFIKFKTDLTNQDGQSLIGWFTKTQRGVFEGFDWGTEEDFDAKQKQLFKSTAIGRIFFETFDECNTFIEVLKEKILGDEPWSYEKIDDVRDTTENYDKYPILKSYLEFELDRLFYEQEELGFPDRIIYNENEDKILFNTNLLDDHGHDLIIAGDFTLVIGGRLYISNPAITPSTLTIKRWGFDSKKEPQTPRFFQDINEIVFHSDWEIDYNPEKYKHITEERVDRFPVKYRKMSTYDLSIKLENAIEFAKKIAQRNYKFVVPMYYPIANRIQLLMPIYLESAFKKQPDFALVLTPNATEKIYVPETILGLREVYQDARLIAKPDESWLNPKIIK